MATINTIIATLMSLSNIPFTLESGIGWDRNMTRFLMENSPFFIRLTSANGIEFVTASGDWLIRTTPVKEVKTFDNGYMYFVTESGHKYNLTKVEDTHKYNINYVGNRDIIQIIYDALDGATPETRYDRRASMEVVNGVNNSRNYRIGFLVNKTKDSNNPFGFVEDAFVSGKFLHLTEYDLKRYQYVPVIAKVNDGPKGKRVSSMKVFTYENCEFLMGEYVNKFVSLAEETFNKTYNNLVKEEDERKERERQWELRRKMEEEERNRKISELGIEWVRISKECKTSNYGGSYSATYTFSTTIDEDTFKKYLTIIGRKTEAKPCYLPISPETVDIYGHGDTWHYSWHGEWDD